MKFFKTNNINLIEECRINCGVILPSALISSRTNKFMFKLQFLENSFCNIFLTSLYIWLNGLLVVLHLLVCLFTLFLYLCLYLFTINLPFLVNKSFIYREQYYLLCMGCL